MAYSDEAIALSSEACCLAVAANQPTSARPAPPFPRPKGAGYFSSITLAFYLVAPAEIILQTRP